MSVQDYTYIGVYGLGGKSTSTGIDDIRDQLNAMGLSGFVINQENAIATALSLVAADTKKKIIFGYSMGATDAIDISRKLISVGHEVELLFTMDPHLMRDQVDGVKRHINVWQPNNLLLIKPFFPVTAVPEAEGYLKNVYAEDIESHGDLEDTPWVQDLFITEVENLVTTPDDNAVPLPPQEVLPPWIAEVNKHLGLHEVHDNAALSDYLQSDGTTLGDPASNPWCGDLVETVYKNTLPDEVIPNNPYWARNWQHFGIKCEPKMHALLVFTRGSGGHVGWYVGETDTHFIVRGGNQSNRVTDTPYAKSRLISARWPKTYRTTMSGGTHYVVDELPEREAFHKAFFDGVRKPLFKGRMGQSQVDGMKMTIDEWFKRPDLSDERWLAYMLATAWLETDRTMQAIMEYGDRAYFTRMYDIKGARPDKARELGNTRAGDGAKFAGRGKPMITGRANYAKATEYVGRHIGIDFEEKPSAVLQGNHSDLLMFSGMIKGWFTGKKLSDYFDGDLEDPIGARRIVNGTDRAEEIADAYEDFLTALDSAFEARRKVVQKVAANPDEGIISDGITVGNAEVSGIPRNISQATNVALIELAISAMTELKRRRSNTSPRGLTEAEFEQQLSENLTVLHDGQASGASNTRPISKYITGVNPMKQVDGSKTYITMAMVAIIAILEGYMGIDVPGAEMQDNWVEYILAAMGVGSVRHAISKLISAVTN